MTLWSPISTRVGLPLVGDVLGLAADDGEGMDDVVLAERRQAVDADVGDQAGAPADLHVGADRRSTARLSTSSAISARGSTHAVSAIRVAMIAGFLRSRSDGYRRGRRSGRTDPASIRPSTSAGRPRRRAVPPHGRAVGVDDHEPHLGLGGQTVADPGHPVTTADVGP